MQYPQQPGWNQQQGGWNQQGYPPQNQNVGYPGGVPQQGGWGGAPQYPAGYGYPGMYPQQGGQPHGMHPGMNPGMYPQQGTPGMYPQHGGYGAQAQPLPPKKAETVKPAANPIDALFGAKADPNATQAAAQQRARRISNPPPVQPTPQESKPAPKRAANYNIDLSEEPSDGGLGIPGSARSSTSSATSQSTLPSSSSSSSSTGVHSSGGSFPPHSGGPPHNNPAIHSGGGFPPGGHPSGAHPGGHPGPNAFPPGHPGAHPQGTHPGHQQPGHQQPGHQQPGHQQPGHQQPGHPGAYPPGGFPQGAHPHGGPGFPPGSFPGHGGFNQYGGFPGGGFPGAGYGAPAINKGSFFLPPTGAPSGAGAPPLTPSSGALPLTPATGLTPLTPSTGSSPLPSPSPTISPVSSQGSFQQGFAQPHPTQSLPSHSPMTPTQRAQSPMLAATAMNVGQPSLLPSSQIQHAMSPSHFLHSNIPMQRSPSFQSTPGPGTSSPSFSLPSNVSPPRTMQQSASASNVPSSTQFQGATSDDWAGSDFTTPSTQTDDFGGFNAPSNNDFGGFNTPSTAVSSGDFGNFNTPSTAVSSGDFGAFNAPSNDDFGFSGFQGATQSPAITVQPPKEQQKDLFDFGTPSTKPTAAHSSPAKPNNLVIDEPPLAPSPKLSRSTKQLEPPTEDDDFFGTAAINKRHSASFTPPPAQDLGFFDEPTGASSTPPVTTPEVPKKPANALESMMENSLFKVTHKAPPMAAAQPQQAQQAQQTQQKPSQPAAHPAKESAKKFDWSSQNYRDIFGEAETAAIPTPNPAIAQEQFEGFVSASDATGASDEFEFGAFESSANSDPFASSSPPTFVTAQFPSNPSTLFPSDNTFGSQPVSLPSPFGPDSSSFGSQPSFPAPNAPGEAFQPSFGAPPSTTPAPVPVSTPPPSLVTPPIVAPSSTPSPFGGAEPFPSSSFQGSSGSEMFSSNRLAPSDPFAPTVDDVPSFDSPFSPPRSATVPAVSTSSPSLSHAPSATPATVSSYPDSEPAFGNFSATRRGSIPKVDDNPFGNAETAFGDFGKHLNNTPPTPANSVVGPPRSPQQVESEPAFGSFFGNASGSTPSSAQGDEASAFGDFFGQSKTSTPPTPANTVVQSDSLSTTTPTESFGSFYGDDSARRTGAQADPALRDFVNQSSSVPPTPANSVDKEGSNSENFFSGASNNLQPSSGTPSSYDSILAKPLNTFNYSPSSSVVAPSTKPNGDWGLPSTNANNNNNNNNNNESPFSTTSKNSNDYFGSPFESTSSSTPFPSSSTSSSTPSTSSTATTTSSSNKNFSLNSNEMFGSSFDTSFGNAPAFPLEDSFGSPEVAKPNFGTSEEFGTFSSFGGEDFGDFSSTTEFGGTSEFGSTSEFGGTTEFGANTEFGDFGPSTPFGEEDITHKPPAAPSLTDLFQSLVQQERLVEANACQGHVKNGTQPSPQELATWTSPNSSHTTIAQLKERLVSHPNQAKILKSFSQFEKQSLAAAASINLQSAIESQKSARQFVTAVLEWQSKWEKQLAWCATELAAAQKLTAEICSSSGMQGWDPKKEIFSQEKWTTYFKALVEVYRVACRLNAAAQHYNVPPSPHYATLAASWSVLSAMLKVDDASIDYSEIWEEGSKHSDCALCHVPIVPSERSTPWDGASYHLSCANVWANRISPVPPHVK